MFDPSNWFGRYLDLVMNLLSWVLVAVGAPGFVLGCHSFIVKIVRCNIRRSIGNGSHTLDRMYTMYTYPIYDQLFSMIGLSLATGACEASMYESGQLIIRTLVPSGPRKLVLRNS